ncbi:hypothetical protein OJ253_3397 [Cryptosporidium canis]|uniref:Uncharacterized protein n=1 Tax=Cryptosporidium canis TaxID=195482 RepID=A0A9D5DIS5_9CRYT|nr:hypothetical protein OJ253_3397 [Cryptosporidium canis]
MSVRDSLPIYQHKEELLALREVHSSSGVFVGGWVCARCWRNDCNNPAEKNCSDFPGGVRLEAAQHEGWEQGGLLRAREVYPDRLSTGFAEAGASKREQTQGCGHVRDLSELKVRGLLRVCGSPVRVLGGLRAEGWQLLCPGEAVSGPAELPLRARAGLPGGNHDYHIDHPLHQTERGRHSCVPARTGGHPPPVCELDRDLSQDGGLV